MIPLVAATRRLISARLCEHVGALRADKRSTPSWLLLPPVRRLRGLLREIEGLTRDTHQQVIDIRRELVEALGALSTHVDQLAIADSRPRASTQFVFRAFPSLSGRVVPMGDIVYRTFNLDPTERYCLGAMAQVLEARRIFEFGTYDGATTLLLARCAPNAEIVTLDLPPDVIAALSDVSTEQIDIAGGVGARFRDQPEAHRITQILGDSRQVDLSNWFGTCDLVLVDGDHNDDIVLADTRNAMRLVSSQGVVVWDDYGPSFPGVIQAVDTVAAELGREVVHIEPTEFAVCDLAGRLTNAEAAVGGELRDLLGRLEV